LEQALPLPKTNSYLFENKAEEQALQNLLDRLSLNPLLWDQIHDPLSLSRLATTRGARTLLHLAVLDDRLEIIEILKSNHMLKLRRDAFGLSPIDIAQFLNREEALNLLQPLSERLVIPDHPSENSFEYLSYPIFETREGFEQVLANVSKAKDEDKIPPEKIWMGIYFDKELRNGLHPPISIRYIDNEVGYGVFSGKKIPPCTYVGEYTGIIQQRDPKLLKEKNHCLRYTIWEGKANFTIDAEQKGNFTRFINHSSKPNLGLQSIYWRGLSRMIFISLKEIREGAQLTFDYGPNFWKHNPKSPKEFVDDL
jgi:hypothetical protein